MSEIGYKIVESVPDKNGIVIIGIKEDSNGVFVSRDKALEYIKREREIQRQIKLKTRKEVLDEISRDCIGKTESEIKDILFFKRVEFEDYE